MYIQPTGVIELYKDIALSPSYDDTLYFSTVQDKDDYFTSIAPTHRIAYVPNVTYTREQRGYIRIEVPTSVCYSATYMRFKNISFENKWFYAFVTNVEYINNSTTQITFEVDYIMTWMGTFNLAECFIERQHTLHDGIGNNICDEGLSLGEYINEGQGVPYDDDVMGIAVVYYNPSETGKSGGLSGGIYNPCLVRTFDLPENANAFIKQMVTDNLSDNIVGVYMYPYPFEPSVNANIPTKIDWEVPKPYNSIDGYVPRNNKLFCYPYKYLEVDNMEGSSRTFAYEYFNTVPDTTSTGNCKFEIWGSVGSTCELTLLPVAYKFKTSSHDIQPVFDERLGISHFPQCAWVTDSYKAYQAQVNANLELEVKQNALSILPNATSGAFSGASGGGVGATIGALGGVISGLFNTLQPITNALVVNTTSVERGSKGSGSQTVNNIASLGYLKFRYIQKCITKNYAMMLDDYFDMFGYAVKQKNVPNMNARPHWTYVKTIGCIVHGDLPSEHSRKIEEIFDKGVRFWKNINEIGNYSLNNKPV